MDGEIDYAKYDESELVDMFSRTDPRWAPVNYARLKELLIGRGYVVRDGGLGPGSAVPSAEKLQSLIGSVHPIECKVTFGQTTGLFRWFEPSHNEFDFADSGTLVADGMHLRLSGRRAGLPGLFGTLFERKVQLNWRSSRPIARRRIISQQHCASDAQYNARISWLDLVRRLHIKGY
jgi:hypothetical protein